MEEFSSDDDIAWGPLTLKEILKELQNEGMKIERRHSDPGRYNFAEGKTCAKSESQKADVSQNDQSLNRNTSKGETEKLEDSTKEDTDLEEDDVEGKPEEIAGEDENLKDKNVGNVRKSREFEDLDRVVTFDLKPMRRSSSLSLDLNDTVKEMDMALTFGLSYIMPEDEKAKEEGKSDCLKEGVFKVPAEPKPRPLKSSKNKYQYVLSPVGLYIKQGKFGEENKENYCRTSSKKLIFKPKSQ